MSPPLRLIYRNKWHPRTSEISTPTEMAVGSHFHAQHGTKTIPVFLNAGGKTSWSLLPSSVFLLWGDTVQPENSNCCILKVTSQVLESQKMTTIITATTSVHLSQPVSTDITIKSYLGLTNPIEKNGVRGWSMW